MEVPHKPRCERGTATSWRCCCTNHIELFNHLPVEVGSVIEASVVQELSEQLNGRLSPVSFDHWHVDIIYEDYTGRGPFRPNAFLPSLLFQLRFYSLLSSVRVSLRRECKLNRGQALFLLICWDIVLHNYTFTYPSAPREKYGFPNPDKHLQNCGVSNCLNCRDHYWEEW